MKFKFIVIGILMLLIIPVLHSVPGINYTSNTLASGTEIAQNSFFIEVSVTEPTSTFENATFNLYNSSGDLNDSQVDTTLRAFSLEHYTINTSNQNLALDDDQSGLAYSPTTNTVYSIRNGDTEINELYRNGTLKRTISLTGFEDTEAICFLNNSGGYDWFAITEERQQDFSIIKLNAATSTISKAASINYELDLGTSANVGLEGIAYDSGRDVYYIVKEKDPMAMYQVDVSSGSPVVTTLFNAPTVFSGVATDLSDIYYDNNTDHLFILSHESTKLMEVTLDGTIIDTLSVSSLSQPEGVTFDTTGETLWIMSEPDSWSIYTAQNFTASYNFTGLSDGLYYYNVTAYDSSDGSNTTVTRNITINMSGDDTAPSINFVSPTPANNTITADNNATINISITESNITEIIYNWNGTNFTIYDDDLLLLWPLDNVAAIGEDGSTVVDLSQRNHTVNPQGTYSFVTGGVHGGAIELNEVNSYLDTEFGNFNPTTISFTVSFWTNRQGNTCNSGDDDHLFGTGVHASNDRFYFRCRTGLWGMRLQGNGAIYGSAVDLNKWYFVTIVNNHTENTAYLYLDGEVELNQSYTSYTIPGNLYVGTISNSIVEGWGGLFDDVMLWNRSLSHEEIQQMYMISLSKYDSNTWNLYVNQTKNATADLDVGTYTYFVSATDGNSNEGTSEIRTITTGTSDNDAPELSIQSPTNNSNYTADLVDLNFTVSDAIAGIDSCWYSVNGGSNVTLLYCHNTTIAPGEGTHSIIFYANDTLGNLNTSDNISFTVDISAPSLAIVSPTNNSNYSTDSVDLNFTVSDATSDADSCWYSLDGGSNTTLASCDNTTIAPGEGTHSIIFYANDTLGNLNTSDNLTFIIDLTAPTVSIDYPTEGLNLSTNESITLNFTVSDSGSGINSSTCTYVLDGGSPVTIASCENTTFNVSSNVNGAHNISISVNDTVGHQGNSSLINFTINTTDTDGDGTPDLDDPLLYTESEVTTTGITTLNITINGTGTNETYGGEQEVRFYDGDTLLFNFSHNFSQSNLDLSNIVIIRGTNYLIINVSGQLQGNKTVYLTDNSFVSLCVKDAEIASISAMSSACNGANETDFTSCLGGSATINGIDCVDEGNTIVVSNLQYSAVRGIQYSGSSSSNDNSRKSMNLEHSFNCSSGLVTIDTAAEGITIDFFGLDNSCNQEKLSGANGDAEFTITYSGLYRLYATKSGYSSVSLNLDLELCEALGISENSSIVDKEQEELPMCGEHEIGETWQIDHECNSCNCSCELVFNKTKTNCECTNKDCLQKTEAETALNLSEQEISRAKEDGKITEYAEEKLLAAQQAYDSEDYYLAEQLANEAVLLIQASLAEQANEEQTIRGYVQEDADEQKNQPFDLSWIFIILGGLIIFVAVAYILLGKKKVKKNK